MKNLTMRLLVLVMAAFVFPGLSYAQSTDDNGLLARHQVRLDGLDSDVRDMRGLLETDLRAVKIQLEKIADTAENADLSVSKIRRDLQKEIARLDDTIEIVEQRLRRTIELSSDIEFRVLRLEKRMETLIAMNLNGNTGGASVAEQMVQDDTIAGGTSPSVSMTRDADTGETVWTVNEDQLNEALQTQNGVADPNAAADGEAGAGDAAPEAGTDASSGASSGAGSGAEAGGENLATEKRAEEAALSDTDDGAASESSISEATPAAPAKPEILPDADAEEQYKFALTQALQNDLEVAEQAFTEFRQFNPEHSRGADALFWLGRVQLMQGQYEKSAMTFTNFNSEYPNDTRIVDTTLWIAESVSQFAEPEQACAIYASLPQLLDAPTEAFTKRMGELADSAGCN